MSSSARLFSHDPETGIKKWFRYHESSSGNESEDSFSIETTQDVTSIVESTKASFNSTDERAKWGEGQYVASIPISIWQDLKKKGIADNEKLFKAWLNDRDNRVFRTRPGRV
jgi:hypothetical protein